MASPSAILRFRVGGGGVLTAVQLANMNSEKPKSKSHLRGVGALVTTVQLVKMRR